MHISKRWGIKDNNNIKTQEEAGIDYSREFNYKIFKHVKRKLNVNENYVLDDGNR